MIARLMQGLSLGGEYASASTYLAELAPDHRRGFFSSFVFFSSAAGILTASAIGWALTTVLTDEQMREFGWRIPFLLGALGGIAGIWLRMSVPEAQASTQNQEGREATAAHPAA